MTRLTGAVQEDYARLAHAASLLETAAFGIETLGEADTACLVQLNALLARLRVGVTHDASLGETLRMLESAQAELQEAVYALRHYQQRLDTDPQRLHEQEQRIQSVMDMARKYRVAPEQLNEALQRIVARLVELGGDADLAELERQERSAQQDYLAAAQKLSAARKKAAVKLAREITAAMQTLAMPGGSFAVELLPLGPDDDNRGNAYGLETIEFQVAANPGVPARSMAKVASGGELSRISLAIQSRHLAHRQCADADFRRSRCRHRRARRRDRRADAEAARQQTPGDVRHAPAAGRGVGRSAVAGDQDGGKWRHAEPHRGAG